uniref:CARD domain-containing protein n=1 Tax=Sphaeramia orbicularis TaxID=375764 RepID=A0A673AI95_9TELE
MACTGQSASQYVEGARRHLVNGLQSLSIILENLFQQEVLCEEEVSKIQAEKDDFDKRRQILDKVIKKGDGACYEFLRIIDKTRQRTLGKPSLENVGFDLHYWISCYPFREDTKMDNKYLQGMVNLYFILCVMTVLIYELRTYLPEEKVQISPSDLMKKNNTILLVGKSGIGKTAVAHEMWRQWAERHDTELDYMLYFDMRGASHFTTAMKLQDLLFNEFSQSDEDRDEVLRDIMKNSEKVTMIFDGVSDLHSSSVVQRLVKKDLLPDAKIIITCRPDDEEDIEDDLPENFLRVEVKGFSEQTIRTYLSENLGEEHKQVVNNLELFTLCHVPMYALMVVVCFSSKTQPCTITELYINIVRFCLQKNSKTRERFLNSYIKTEGEKILALAKAAFDATERKSVILTGLGCEDTCVCPFLKTLNIKVAPTDTETTSAFLHYTMQEFFAALWLLKNPRQMKDVLQSCEEYLFEVDCSDTLGRNRWCFSGTKTPLPLSASNHCRNSITLAKACICFETNG